MMLLTLPEFITPQAVATNNLRGEVLATRVIRLLADAGIRAILLKGPAIRLWLYDDGTPRLYADVDLLVDPALITAAELALSGAGFEHPPDDPWGAEGPWHAREWMKPGDEVRVELHRTLSGIGVEPDVAWRLLRERSAPFPLRGAVVEVLDIPARAMHIALHAAQDGGRVGKSLDDLHRALDKVSFEEWSIARDIATALHAVPAFAAGLRLAPEGARIADELHLARATTTEIALRSSGGKPPLAIEWIATRQRSRDRMSAVLRKTFPSPAFMRDKYKLAGRGTFGLTLSYVGRLAWLLWTLPSAYKSWLDARRKAS